MSVRDLGERMTAYELTVLWPAFFKWRQETQEREEKRQQAMDERKGRRR